MARRAFSVRYCAAREMNVARQRAIAHANERLAGVVCSSRALDHARKCACETCTTIATNIQFRIDDGTYPPYHAECAAMPNLHPKPQTERVIN